MIIADFAIVRSRANSENLNISMQNLFKVSKREGFQNGTVRNLKSDTSDILVHVRWEIIKCF